MEKSQLGIISSSWSLAYGISKFAGGILSDRVSPRWLYALGLGISGATCIAFGGCNSVMTFATLWFLNGIFQGFGWPAITQLVNNWCTGTELASWWSALSSAGNIGLTLAPFLITGLVKYSGWRFTFFVMGCIAILVATVIPLVIQDAPSTPVSPQTGAKKKGPAPSVGTILALCRNPMILLVSLAYFLVSLIKEGWSNWGLLYLLQHKDTEEALGKSMSNVLS